MPADSQQMQVARGTGSIIERDENGRFVRGQSGNPLGRAAGTRNRATLLVEQLFDGACAALANKAVEMALAGDVVALRLCIGRIIAPRRDRPSGFALPPLASAADLAPAVAAIAAAVADGTLSTAEAWELAQVVDNFGRACETGEFEARLQRLETVHGASR